jgi:uncharacterized protein involved in response to NO
MSLHERLGTPRPLPGASPAAAARPSTVASIWIAAQHPLWQCGLRPFFLAGCALALGVMAWWALVLLAGAPLPPSAQTVGVAAWHGHALLLGLGLAATAGFLLTAVPEFTSTPEFGPRTVRALAALWAGGCLASCLPGAAAQALAGLAWVALLAALLVLAGPRLWHGAAGRHRSFIAALALLLLAVLATQWDVLRGLGAGCGLRAVLAAYLALVVVVLGRVSMRIVNDAIDEARRDGRADAETTYLSRPPKRQLAVACILLHGAVQWAWPQHAALPWLALACAAALAHGLGDWHIGRSLLQRWALALYAVPLTMALAYVALGLGPLLAQPALALGAWHALAIGGFGLPILLVLAIAGRAHVGLLPWAGPGFVLAVLALLGAAAARAAWAGGWAQGLGAAALLWLAAWAWVAWRLAPAWWEERPDGSRGCAGPDDGAC